MPLEIKLGPGKESGGMLSSMESILDFSVQAKERFQADGIAVQRP